MEQRNMEQQAAPGLPQAGNPGATAYPVYAPYPKRRGAGRDLALAGVLLVFCFLLWDALAWAEGLGLGEALGLAALLPAALVYLRGRAGRLSVYGWICAGLYEAGAVSLALSGDLVLKYLTFFALALLFLLVVLERLGLWTGAGLLARVHDLCVAAFSMTFGRLGAGVWALTHRGEADGAHSKRSRAILVGLACAIPALLVVVPLLISSDAAFAGLVGRLDWDGVGRGILALAMGGFMALGIFTLLFTSDRGPNRMLWSRGAGLEPAAVAAFLGAIGAAYLLYLLAQFAYFTDAFRGLLPKDFTVAEYARRGFFEMCAIVTINLTLLAGAAALCRKEAGRLPGPVKALALYLCLFSLALVATALSKMVLYMGSFGLTRLRLLTSAFMVYLGVILLAEGLKLFLPRIPGARLAVTLGAALLIGLSLANVDGAVARYNVNAWKTGKLDGLDLNHICWLGDGAVPTLAELAEDPDPEIREAARKELDARAPETDWRSWNLIAQEAADAMQKR